jgi:hypothetical protein
MVSTRTQGSALPPHGGGRAEAKEAKLALAVSGIFFAFSYFAVLQEDVFRKSYGADNERFKATFLVLVVRQPPPCNRRPTLRTPHTAPWNLDPTS